jgi:quercetin dioxygenase-like cupin family protein
MIWSSRSWVLLTALLVAAQLAPGSDNDSKPLFENDRIRIVRVELPKDATLPDDVRYDAVTVQLTPGDTKFREEGNLEKSEQQGTGQVHYFVARSKRQVKNAGQEPVSFVLAQFLRTPGKYVALDIPETHYCNPGSATACVTEKYLFCTDKFCAEDVTLGPGAISTQHTHDSDHIVIATSDFTWREEATGKPPEDIKFKVGDAHYEVKGITHRLTNVGKTTATMFVIQYK